MSPRDFLGLPSIKESEESPAFVGGFQRAATGFMGVPNYGPIWGTTRFLASGNPPEVMSDIGGGNLRDLQGSLVLELEAEGHNMGLAA